MKHTAGQDRISDLMARTWQTTEDKGFHDSEATSPVERLMLIVSELSEAMEEYRNGHPLTEIYYVDGKPEGVPIELADVGIRLFEMCQHYGIPLVEALDIKMDYNDTRSYRHGGKRI